MQWTVLDDGWIEARVTDAWPMAELGVGPALDDTWTYWVELHDGTPSMPDGLPETLQEVGGSGYPTEEAAMFAAERHYDRLRIIAAVWEDEMATELERWAEA